LRRLAVLEPQRISSLVPKLSISEFWALPAWMPGLAQVHAVTHPLAPSSGLESISLPYRLSLLQPTELLNTKVIPPKRLLFFPTPGVYSKFFKNKRWKPCAENWRKKHNKNETKQHQQNLELHEGTTIRFLQIPSH